MIKAKILPTVLVLELAESTGSAGNLLMGILGRRDKMGFLWRDVEITDRTHRSSPPLFQKSTYLSFDFTQPEGEVKQLLVA